MRGKAGAMLGMTRASLEAPGLGLGDQYLWAVGWVGNSAQVSTLGVVWTGSHPAGGGDARLQDRRVVREAGRGGATGARREELQEGARWEDTHVWKAEGEELVRGRTG